ncbi:efflux RND transporter permease subunit [Photobacterium lutimaris]|uniref:SSD domain-containing protein n=1 Tax=Photobacterium lutimaris TaxID=388278 RepID=A0A2T3IWG7_9GAMM|nr:MMPL family transporter [Photobacterium lutimaris]PSU32788.1 hypothetical protein C9I99_17240 [Photobacterium lutimaris]TDR74403.1 hypothetical protein DFP78_108262 [Photobacterium lutimaris]
MDILTRYCQLVAARYRLFVAGVVIITLTMVYMTTHLGINATPYFLDPSHPSRLADKHLKETFTGSGENLMVATVTEQPSIFNSLSLAELHRFTLALEQLSLTVAADAERVHSYLLQLEKQGTLNNQAQELKARLTRYLGGEQHFAPFSAVDYSQLKRLGRQFELGGLMTAEELAGYTDFLTRVAPIHKVRSIVRIESVTASGDELDIHPMMFQIPDTEAGITALQEEAYANPLLRNILFSDNPQVINTLVELSILQDDAPNMRRVYNAILALVEQEGFSDSYHLGGPPAIFAQTSATMENDSNTFFPVVFAVVMLLLYVLFRNVRNMLLPVLVAVISVIWTMGTMAIFGVQQNIVSTMLPVFLIAIGVADSIHFLSEYRSRTQRGENRPVAAVVGVLFRPMLMTSVTTMVGFLSLTYTPIRFIQEFGIFVAVGVGYAFVITMVLLPALQYWLKPEKAANLQKSPLMTNWIKANVDLVVRHPRRIWFGAALVLLLSAAGVTRLTIDNEMIGYFSSSTKVYQDNEVFKNHLAGGGVIEFIVSAEQADYFKQAAAVEGLEQASNKLKSLPYVGDVYDLPAFMKLMNKALHGDDPAAYHLPQGAEDIYAQYLFLYENSNGDEIFNVVSEAANEARIIVFVRSDKTSVMDNISSTIVPYIEQQLPDVKVTPAGFGEVLIATRDEIIYSQISSLLLSFGFVFLALLGLFRSLIYAVIGIVPLLLTVTINFAIMGWSGLFLDVGTAIVAPIAIGIGVDYAIYFINSCRRQGTVSAETLQRTLSHLYPPIVFNTLVQGCGFLVLALSSHQALINLGILVSLTMLVTAVVTLLMLPSIMLLLFGAKSSPVTPAEEAPAS